MTRESLDNGAWCDYPRVCAACGGKLRITKDRLWLEAVVGRSVELQTWHWACRARSVRVVQA